MPRPTQDLMRALVLHQPRELSVEWVPVPKPGPGDLLIRVKAATTCGTDLKAFLRGHPQIPMPGVFGHEYSGEVVEAGGGSTFKPGDSVMGVHSAPCKQCKWCLGQQENLCESIMETKVLGSYAEYLLIPARIAVLNVFRKPKELSYAQASLLEPLSCVMQGLTSLGLAPGVQRRFLVIGPGAIGLMFASVLNQNRSYEVHLAGRNEDRLAIARQMGIQTVQLAEVEDKYDAVIECTGKVEVWESSIDFVERGGTLLLFGGCPPGSRACFDTARMHYDQVKLVSPFHFGTAAVKLARGCLLNPKIDLSPVISGTRKLEQGLAVFQDLEAGKGIKYVFEP